MKLLTPHPFRVLVYPPLIKKHFRTIESSFGHKNSMKNYCSCVKKTIVSVKNVNESKTKENI